MTSRDRDPGKIAQAFIPEALLRRRNYAANNPHSEAALRAEASRGRTSSPSPSRVSGARRRQLTGVTERFSQQGWAELPTALPHLCFPPDQYPQGIGPGSRWLCRCDAVWVSDGIAWDEYPTEPARTSTPLKPERWHYVGGGQLSDEDYLAQEALYDWRPLGPYCVRLYRAMIDNQLGKFTSWEELG